MKQHRLRRPRESGKTKQQQGWFCHPRDARENQPAVRGSVLSQLSCTLSAVLGGYLLRRGKEQSRAAIFAGFVVLAKVNESRQSRRISSSRRERIEAVAADFVLAKGERIKAVTADFVLEKGRTFTRHLCASSAVHSQLFTVAVLSVEGRSNHEQQFLPASSSS